MPAPTPDPVVPSCGNCTYFKLLEKLDGIGHCRRYPPNTPIPGGSPGWPTCKVDDWCGEYKAVKN